MATPSKFLNFLLFILLVLAIWVKASVFCSIRLGLVTVGLLEVAIAIGFFGWSIFFIPVGLSVILLKLAIFLSIVTSIGFVSLETKSVASISFTLLSK